MVILGNVLKGIGEKNLKKDYMYQLLFLLSYIMFVAPHEFHVSKALVEFNESEQALQVSMHLFIDDLEEGLQLGGVQETLNLCTSKEHENAEAYLSEYLKKKFKILVNEELLDFEFLGKEPSEDLIGIWCYLEITNISSINAIQIENSILLEAFEDQKNIISLIGPNKKKDYFLFKEGYFSDNVSYK